MAGRKCEEGSELRCSQLARPPPHLIPRHGIEGNQFRRPSPDASTSHLPLGVTSGSADGTADVRRELRRRSHRRVEDYEEEKDRPTAKVEVVHSPRAPARAG
ncbi:hypothetical protein HPP92_025188 [Vanilla planifolia]|uniref:Uncharacterized protein n=1 Tax=Vanilla planifolia TaxID=51239 RepID=A0A835PLF5_VANPL|nr:hypothetical protein HPP92_025188 [Vanilla planifolia]